MPTPGEVGPGSAAAGVMMATRTLANELSQLGITVNAVALSVIQDTELLRELVEDSVIGSVLETALKRQVFETTSEDVAELVCFLAPARTVQGRLPARPSASPAASRTEGTCGYWLREPQISSPADMA